MRTTEYAYSSLSGKVSDIHARMFGTILGLGVTFLPFSYFSSHFEISLNCAHHNCIEHYNNIMHAVSTLIGNMKYFL